jgi:ABC-type sugar transport system ATPase subunit
MADDVVGPDPPALAVREISKRYGMTQALKGVSLEIRSHQIHSLVGENGAGKSTLVRIITGNVQPDEGTILIDGEPVTLTPDHANQLGIAAVHQELSLLPNLTIAQNLSIEQLPLKGGPLGRAAGVLDRQELRRRAQAISDRLGETWNPDTLVSSLNLSQRQRLEISRALLRDARILVLDEPTSSLVSDDRRDLLRQLRSLRNNGIAIVFIAHNIEEALSISDRITVLRDGESVGTQRSAEATVEGIVELMTGRQIGKLYPQRNVVSSRGTPRLSVRDIRAEPFLRGVSFEIYAGEIVGLAGLAGAGRTKILRSIFGMLPISSGEILLDGERLNVAAPADAIRLGIGLIPEDRHAEGIFQSHSVEHNILVAAAVGIQSARSWIVALPRRLQRLVREMIRRLDIKAGSPAVWASQLSGGNQQKLVLARWIAIGPRLLLADDPTRGVSVGSKREIYRTLKSLTAEGVSVLMVSSEFDELIGICDRIILVRNGSTVGATTSEGLTGADLLHLVLAESGAQLAGQAP